MLFRSREQTRHHHGAHGDAGQCGDGMDRGNIGQQQAGQVERIVHGEDSDIEQVAAEIMTLMGVNEHDMRKKKYNDAAPFIKGGR